MRQDAYGWKEWVRGVPFHTTFTGTFARSRDSYGALKSFQSWADAVNGLGEGIWWLASVEVNTHVHVHAALGGTDKIPRYHLYRMWRRRFGRQVKIMPYFAWAGWLDYILKENHSDTLVMRSERMDRQVGRWIRRRTAEGWPTSMVTDPPPTVKVGLSHRKMIERHFPRAVTWGKKRGPASRWEVKAAIRQWEAEGRAFQPMDSEGELQW